ncbi:hypothetical protein GCM10011414_11030 [Croceivirga lutea]|uniref:HPF/RaiA family ribosome-associated protein n=1 Tax=Croceivirga lutea TaxID=1775167 RepID=UPI00163B3481|nr:HPF/RaiA family ribosome-associated protein [Croceivirga lutea]GGG43185.1 hypothetical protein GCM10011414_11030 [Croceivirga lutea]
MTFNIQFQKMPESESLRDRIMLNLEKLANRYSFIINAQVLFKQENNSKGKGKICEIELSGPGPRLFAKSDTDDFEKAAAETLKELERQLRKRKETFSKKKKIN